VEILGLARKIELAQAASLAPFAKQIPDGARGAHRASMIMQDTETANSAFCIIAPQTTVCEKTSRTRSFTPARSISCRFSLSLKEARLSPRGPAGTLRFALTRPVHRLSAEAEKSAAARMLRERPGRQIFHGARTRR
jgi:hypothetical protein